MPSKLTIYNGALTVLGERKLADLTENREPRYKLDDVWDNDLIRRVLQMGQWNFAKRTVELESSPSVTPSFGYQFAFDKPSDFVRTIGVAHDEYFNIPITRYSDEASWLFCDQEKIYVAYVSDDTQWGADLSLPAHGSAASRSRKRRFSSCGNNGWPRPKRPMRWSRRPSSRRKAVGRGRGRASAAATVNAGIAAS